MLHLVLYIWSSWFLAPFTWHKNGNDENCAVTFNVECDFFILSLLDIKKDEKQAAIIQLAQYVK